MKITVKVIPNASKNHIEAGEVLRIYVTASPDKGKANDAVIALLSAHFHVPKRSISLVSGATSRLKCFSISDSPLAL